MPAKNEHGLTPQQEHFAQMVASGKSQSDAYRDAYDVKPRTKPSTVWEAASRIAADSKVSARIEELKKELEGKALITREELLHKQLDVAREAREDGNYSASTSALKAASSMLGYDQPKVVNVGLASELMSLLAEVDGETKDLRKG